MIFRQTATTLSAATGALLAAENQKRVYLAVQVTGAEPATIGFDSTPTAGLGITLDGGEGAATQGGSWEWTGPIPWNALYGISTSGTTVVVVEGFNQVP